MELPKFSKKRKGKALIIEGGGMRGAFAGGVLASMARYRSPDYYDLVVAVSSGSCSAAYYVTEPNPSPEDIERALDIWRVELAGSRLISIWNLLKGKRLLDQDYLIDSIFQEKAPIKIDMLERKKAVPLYVSVSSFRTLQATFLKATEKNLFPLLRAATSLPIATKGFDMVEEEMYTDGGVLDPVPVEAVLQAGYKEITLVLTKPTHYVQSALHPILGGLAFPKFPLMGKMLSEKRHTSYNRAMEILRDPPNGIRLEILAPEENLPASRMSTDPRILTRTVQMGLELGEATFR